MPDRHVPLIKPDLPTFDEIAGPLRTMLESGKLTNFGVHNQAFEREVQAYLRVPTAVAVSSGSLGLLYALQALDVRAGLGSNGTRPVVLLPSFTFMATVQSVLYAGCRPAFVEAGDDGNIDVEDLGRQLTDRPDVVALVAVHVFGLPCDVDAIDEVVKADARRRGRRLKVVYDAAHAFGSALSDGRRVGGFGDAEVFSLSITKALVCVEGGMVTSNDPAVGERVRYMRNYGIRSSYDAAWPGINGKMSELHALIGQRNLARLDERLARRRQLAILFQDQIHRRTSFRTIPSPPGIIHTYKDFVVRVPPALAGKRDAVCSLLKGRGIETRAYFFPPAHEQELFREYVDRPLPRTERLSREVITLPFFTSMAPDEIDYVVEGLAQAERALA